MVWAVTRGALGAEGRALGPSDGSPLTFAVALAATEAANGLGVDGRPGGLSSVLGGLVPCWCAGWVGRWVVGFEGCRLDRWVGLPLLAPVTADDGTFGVRPLVQGARRGGCCDGSRGPLACGPHLDESDRLLHCHLLVDILEEVLLDVCIGQADAELVSNSLLPLVVNHVTTRALLHKATHLRLATEACCESANWFPPVLDHPGESYPGYLWVLLPDSEGLDGSE